ncbi:hypothetical protein FRC10_001475 [Ceratobasidium sp. 414]|nr:hypothetical protein FRC10_001475 [Ceratobasidium sp. 414]
MEDPGDPSSSVAEAGIEQETPSPRVGDGEKINKRAEVDPASQRTISKYFAKEGGKDLGSLGVGGKVRGSAEFKAAGKDVDKLPEGAARVEKRSLGASAKTRFGGQHSDERPVPGEMLEGMAASTKVTETIPSDAFRRSPTRPASSRALTRQKSLQSAGSRAPNEGRKRKTEMLPKEQLPEEESNESSGAPAPKPKAKKKRTKRGYAPPEVYAHLNFVQDCLDYELNMSDFVPSWGACQQVVAAGVEVLVKSRLERDTISLIPAMVFGNVFTREVCLTDTLIAPSQDHTLPERFKLGITNLVDRPSAEMGELSMEERRAGVPQFLRKVHKWRPKIVCMVGKGIWEDVFAYVVKASKGKNRVEGIHVQESSESDTEPGKLNFEFDIQPVCLLHGSGKANDKQLADKIELFKLLNKRWSELENGTLNKRIKWEIRAEAVT